MRCSSFSLFACVASCALAVSTAPAAVHATTTLAAPAATSVASGPQAPPSRSNGASRRQSHALTRAARKARNESKGKLAGPKPTRVIVRRASNKNFGVAQNAAQTEINARAERLYRASQVSAPIIIDAKACKRVGAHGESIYENC